MSNHHDVLFKEVFGEPRYAAQHLRETLPAAVLARIDLNTLQRVERSFVDADLSERHADLLFTVRLKSGERALLYMLFEHQSTPDPLMPYRMVVYTLRIWDHWLKEHPDAQRLPLVYPLVLYHGQRLWTAPLDLAGLIDLPDDAVEDFADVLPHLRYQLADLSQEPDEALTSGALVALVKLLFKHDHQPDLPERLLRWQEIFLRAASEGGLRAVELTARYILEVTDPGRSVPVLKQLSGPVLGDRTEEFVMNVATTIRDLGRKEGLREGRTEALKEARRLQVRVLVSLLERRFGAVSPAARARVEAADLDTLTGWTERILSVESIDALLSG
ncbi:MAG: Rpn family recombination-promoting nuclease/putative transposase [Alphaproteobacteria bacterium]|nr:Rpn family recombination-promoting nuclease/putative transposase [Alphaproteobacteria bacterium]